MKLEKLLVVKKVSELEFYYKGNHDCDHLQNRHFNNAAGIEEITGILDANNVKYDLVTIDNLSRKLVDSYDAVISAGGDGNVISIANYNYDIPQLNLKTDPLSKGALCQIDIAKSLKSFLDGNYTLEKWTRQDVFLDGKFVSLALNETGIGEDMNFMKMAKYELNGNYTQNSGIIIVTGTGSTGWGNEFEPYERTSKLFKYKVGFLNKGVKSGEGEYFKIKYLGHQGNFSIFRTKYDFPFNSELEIKVSEHPLSVVVPR